MTERGKRLRPMKLSRRLFYGLEWRELLVEDRGFDSNIKEGVGLGEGVG
jgi:hypothetical protein